MKLVVVFLSAPVERNHVLVSFVILVAEQSELPLDEGGVILELARGVVVLYGKGEARASFVQVQLFSYLIVNEVIIDVWIVLGHHLSEPDTSIHQYHDQNCEGEAAARVGMHKLLSPNIEGNERFAECIDLLEYT